MNRSSSEKNHNQFNLPPTLFNLKKSKQNMALSQGGKVILNALLLATFLFAGSFSNAYQSFNDFSSQTQAYKGNPRQDQPQVGEIFCPDHGKKIPVMNEKALEWKETKKSGFKARAWIKGQVVEIYPDRSGHRHFSIQIGPQKEDVIEVIYNVAFGEMPIPSLGSEVQACGDFIVATQQNNGYPPSPDGAIIHWVHKNPRNSGHDDGWVIINNTTYGGVIFGKQSVK